MKAIPYILTMRPVETRRCLFTAAINLKPNLKRISKQYSSFKEGAQWHTRKYIYPRWFYTRCSNKDALFRGALCAPVRPNLFSCNGSVHTRVTRQPLPAGDKLLMEAWNEFVHWSEQVGGMTRRTIMNTGRVSLCVLSECVQAGRKTHTPVLFKHGFILLARVRAAALIARRTFPAERKTD